MEEDKPSPKIKKPEDLSNNQQIYVLPPGYMPEQESDEIDLLALWNVIWNGKWIVIAITGFFAISSLIIVLMLPNIYNSYALLAPAEESQGGGLSAMVGQLGGLASLAGISLPEEEMSKTTLAIETLKSRKFIKEFVDRHKLIVPLMAAQEWDQQTNKLILDDDIYDETSNKWVRDVDPPKPVKPSDWEVYEQFSEILHISQDKKTGIIKVVVEFYSPGIAKQWVDWLVEDVNKYMKIVDVKQAKKSIRFLEEQIEKTAITDMRTVFYQLIEQQTKTIMLAEVREEYVFKTVDGAVVADFDEEVKPKRAIICIVTTMLGGFLGVLWILIFGRGKDLQKGK